MAETLEVAGEYCGMAERGLVRWSGGVSGMR